jgi:hypothetical protein
MSAMDAATAIMTALSAVDGVYATVDTGTSLATFPAVVLSVPDLDFTNSPYNDAQPASAEFQVYVVVRADGYALANLEAAVVPVIEALWAVPNVVTQDLAVRGTFTTGTTQLPCYVLTVAASL